MKLKKRHKTRSYYPRTFFIHHLKLSHLKAINQNQARNVSDNSQIIIRHLFHPKITGTHMQFRNRTIFARVIQTVDVRPKSRPKQTQNRAYT